MTPSEIEERYGLRTLDADHRDTVLALSEVTKEYVRRMDALLPKESREKSLFLTKVEEALHWAIEATGR